MTRFLSTRLDLSRLQAIRPAVLVDIDFEALLVERLARLQEELPAVDVLGLETDPLVRLQRVDAYREMLDRHRLNEGFRALLPAFARGTDLDHIALRAGILRQELTPATPSSPAVMEPDDALRLRYFAAFGAPAAGSEDAYVFAALTAWPGAWDVRCVGPDEHGQPGAVDVVLTAPDGQTVATETLAAVSAALNAKTVRPLTDQVSVLAATIEPYAVALTAEILPGPDPAAVRTDIVARLGTITAERYRAGGEVPLAALAAAGYAAGAVMVSVMSPVTSIARSPYAAPWCTSIAATVVERLHG
ncbi:baseplate assembly protein [Prosthecodimorpha staleyi]|uniref:Baseplate J/gp47 family protein n=1 Tax=Prosthecodimorpha staleyi TaxID=2840188 RepID=A0A947DC39_9HYPH|nr:baseplate J/gp47 family protein [Prosthecodimorpha staleyi]MBT9291854.1 baseplate J/gp47 family protein [Prosthecodimorpha staleyi]